MIIHHPLDVFNCNRNLRILSQTILSLIGDIQDDMFLLRYRQEGDERFKKNLDRALDIIQGQVADVVANFNMLNKALGLEHHIDIRKKGVKSE